MKTLAYRLAQSIKKANPEETHSVEVMQYSLTVLLNTFLIIITTIAIGLAADKLPVTVITLLSLMILRMLSGGFHIRSAWGCYLVSVFLCVSIPLVPDLPGTTMRILNLVSLVIMVLFAPNPDRNTRLPASLFPVLKAASIALAVANVFLESQVIGLAFFVQSITIIPWRREGKP